jgi:hypothetical protein
MVLRNVGVLPQHHTVSQPRELYLKFLNVSRIVPAKHFPKILSALVVLLLRTSSRRSLFSGIEKKSHVGAKSGQYGRTFQNWYVFLGGKSLYRKRVVIMQNPLVFKDIIVSD